MRICNADVMVLKEEKRARDEMNAIAAGFEQINLRPRSPRSALFDLELSRLPAIDDFTAAERDGNKVVALMIVDDLGAQVARRVDAARPRAPFRSRCATLHPRIWFCHSSPPSTPTRRRH